MDVTPCDPLVPRKHSQPFLLDRVPNFIVNPDHGHQVDFPKTFSLC